MSSDPQQPDGARPGSPWLTRVLAHRRTITGQAGLRRHTRESLVAKGLSSALVRLIGLAEVAAAAGLVAGIWWQPLGIAAAVGMAVLLLGAIGFHVKWGDYGDSASRGGAMVAVLFVLVAVAAAVTLAASQ
ncbi:DoxX family protein [Streptomyces sp. NPDC058394]|uniref:DoxX family protein n=1 Tax=unclassified Streptomyces TaxID=2593676 RepID=UPI0036484A55